MKNLLRLALLIGLVLGAAACGPLQPASGPPTYNQRGTGGGGNA